MFAVSKNTAVITILLYKTWNLLFKITLKYFKAFDGSSWCINNLGLFSYSLKKMIDEAEEYHAYYNQDSV